MTKRTKLTLAGVVVGALVVMRVALGLLPSTGYLSISIDGPDAEVIGSHVSIELQMSSVRDMGGYYRSCELTTRSTTGAVLARTHFGPTTKAYGPTLTNFAVTVPVAASDAAEISMTKSSVSCTGEVTFDTSSP